MDFQQLKMNNIKKDADIKDFSNSNYSSLITSSSLIKSLITSSSLIKSLITSSSLIKSLIAIILLLSLEDKLSIVENKDSNFSAFDQKLYSAKCDYEVENVQFSILIQEKLPSVQKNNFQLKRFTSQHH